MVFNKPESNFKNVSVIGVNLHTKYFRHFLTFSLVGILTFRICWNLFIIPTISMLLLVRNDSGLFEEKQKTKKNNPLCLDFDSGDNSPP